MNTPWGQSDHKTTYMRGFHFVNTPGHGGFAVSKALALKLLSPKAIAIAGQELGGYIFFEEDCAFAFPLFESETLYNAYTSKNTRSIPLSKEDLKKTIEQWFPNYFHEPLTPFFAM